MSTQITLNEYGKSRGFGTVLFETHQDVEKAIQLFNLYELDGRKIQVREDWAGKKDSQKETASGMQNDFGNLNLSDHPNQPNQNDGIKITSRFLYVGNLPYSTKWQDLKVF